jgi:hypothetical protein
MGIEREMTRCGGSTLDAVWVIDITTDLNFFIFFFWRKKSSTVMDFVVG